MNVKATYCYLLPGGLISKSSSGHIKFFLFLLPQLLSQGTIQEFSSESTDCGQAFPSSLTLPHSGSPLSAENTQQVDSMHCGCWASLAIITFITRKEQIRNLGFSIYLTWHVFLESINQSLGFVPKDGKINYNIISLPVLPFYHIYAWLYAYLIKSIWNDYTVYKLGNGNLMRLHSIIKLGF